jgi:hypothetical protein
VLEGLNASVWRPELLRERGIQMDVKKGH